MAVNDNDQTVKDSGDGGDDDEDDYLNMTFDEAPRKETSLQRTAREKRERWERAHPLSKQEIAVRREAELRKALSTKIDESSKGAQMLQRMGFKGGALGKSTDARSEPLDLNLKTGRAGIGLESDNKRKLQEAAADSAVNPEHALKRKKIDLDDYRQQMRAEQEDRQASTQLQKAMRVLEDLHAREIESPNHGKAADSVPIDKRPLKRVPLLYRQLVRERRQADLDRIQKSRLVMGRLHGQYEDHGLGNASEAYHDADVREIEDLDEDEVDEELDQFVTLPAAEARDRVIEELRTRYCYCLWCAHRYKDEEELLVECPGPQEDDHDA